MAKRRPKYPHGMLDVAALKMLSRHPEMTTKEMGVKLGCNPNSLKDSKVCPLTVRLRAQLRAAGQDRRPGGARSDRRRNGRPLPGDDES
jgi:hypothetical protein